MVQEPSTNGTEIRTIFVQIARETLRKLDALAEATGRPRAWHIDQALDAYLDVHAWQLEHIEKGIAAIEAGRVIPHEKVREWLSSWGKDDEIDPPQ